MTDLKGYCLTCGKHTLNAGGYHACHEHPVIAHLRARIAELEEVMNEPEEKTETVTKADALGTMFMVMFFAVVGGFALGTISQHNQDIHDAPITRHP